MMRVHKELVGAAALAVVVAFILASAQSFALPEVAPGGEPEVLPAATPGGEKTVEAENPDVPQLDDWGMTTEQLQIDQAPLFGFLDRVEEISVADPGNPAAGGEFDTPNKTLIVYWRGEPPAELLALNDTAAEIGYRVVIRPAAFSAVELKVAMDDLVDLAGGGRDRPPDMRFPGGLSVGMEPDGSGLTVSYPGLAGVDVSPDGEYAFDATDQVREAMAVIAARGIPVREEYIGIPTY